MNIIEQLNWRYATKQFDPNKKISDQNWHLLQESLRLSPSSFGLQPWKFIVVTDPKIKEDLTPLSWNQTQVKDCSHFVVFTYCETIDQEFLDHFIETVANTRGVEQETLVGYKKVIENFAINNPDKEFVKNWSLRQSYIAMGFLLSAAAQIQIDSCPMEGLEPKKYDEYLKLNDTPFRTAAAVALGYRHADDKYQRTAKVRFSEAEVIDAR